MYKIFLVILGTVSLCLGVLGIFLPVLPTTPFLLLTAFCYMRGSRTLYEKLMRHERLGAYIRNFQEQKAISLRVKIISVSVLWLTIGISAFLCVEKVWIRILLLAVGIGVTIHILSYRTLGQSQQKNETAGMKNEAK